MPPYRLEKSRFRRTSSMNTIRIVELLYLKSILPVLLWMSESFASAPEVSNSMLQMKAVKDKILQGYDKTIRPTLGGINTTFVAVEVVPRQILDVDEDRGSFVLDSYLTVAWEDPRLKWNLSEYDGVLHLPVDLLWSPNIIVYNSHKTQINPNGEALASVLAEGLVSWMPHFQTETSCQTTIHRNGVITCNIIIGPRGYGGWEIDVLRDTNLHLKHFLNINPRWELLTSQTKVVANRTGHNSNLKLTIFFPVKRKIPLEIEVARQLCTLAMLLTLLIFCLPTNSSKKILLGTMLFFILAQLLFYVAWSTRYPITVLFADSLFEPAIYVVVATLFLQVLVIFNICKMTRPTRPPTIVMQLLKGHLGKFLLIQFLPGDNENIPVDEIQLQEDKLKSLPSSVTRNDWMLLANCLDRVFLILMSIVVIVVHS